jgi:hypothetical protein
MTGRMLIAALALAASPAAAATYADLAALTLASPVIVRATVVKAERLSPADAPGLAPGTARLLVRAKVAAALLAPDAVPADLSYLVETTLDAKGKPPKLKDAGVLLFLRPGARPGEYALTSAKAQLPDAPAAEATVRAVLGEMRASVPVVTGVASAFRVPGAVPGEAESQFFLATADGRPISLVVLTRPGQARTVSLALGDVIDDAAAGVKPDTLLWYRLACFLPRTLPAAIGGEDRAGLADDWAFAVASLGACARSS